MKTIKCLFGKSISKLLLICLILFAGYARAIAQKEPWISLEIRTDYIYYPISDLQPSFNYGVSILVSENFNRSMVSLGFSFSTLNVNYNYTSNGSNNLIRREYHTVYLNLPIIYTYKIPVSKKIEIGILNGVFFSIPRESNVISYYNNRSPNEEDLIYSGKGSFGIKIKLGSSLYYSINKRLKFFGGPFLDLLIYNPPNSQSLDYKNTPHSWDIGFGIGIEYNWKQKNE